MDLAKHIDKIAEAYNKAYNKLDVWRSERENARNALNKKADKLTREAMVEENNKMIEEFTEKSDVIKAELSEAVEKAEDAFRQELKAFYAVNGNAIDEGDKLALDSGIMTVSEISEMVVKHAENPTMLRIIRKYTQDNKIMLATTIERTLHLATTAGEKELNVMSKMKSLLDNAINFATSTEYSRELFLNTALKKDQYVQEAKMELLKAKLFIDDETRELLEKYSVEQKEKHNANYDPHDVDYNWH